MPFWYDSKLIEGDTLPIEITNPGLLYGATVFTTLRVYENSLDHPLTNWQSHCDRLHHSLQVFGWEMPDWQKIVLGMQQLLTSFPVLRIAIFPDGKELIIGRNLPADLSQRQHQGITAWVANSPELRRDLAAHKTGNYLGAWLALRKATELGASEAILVDNQGNWLETSTGNLWGWRDGCWHTPPLSGEILPGTTRALLIDWLRNAGEDVRENVWDGNFVAGLEAIAYSNSVMEVIPIVRVIDGESNFACTYNLQSVGKLQQFFS